MAPQISKEVAVWNSRFEAAKSARQPFEEQWYYNMAFYFGRQYAIWERGTVTRLIEPPAPRNRVRLISNKIKPIIRRELAKVNKEEPQFFCVPNTTEMEDVRAAYAAENIAEYCLYTSKFNVARRSAAFWALLCGSSFIKTTCPGDNADILYEPVTAFHLFVPFVQLETLQSQPYLFHNRAVDIQTVFETYGVELEPDAAVDGGTLEQRFFNALGIRTNNKEADKTQVYLKEVWVKPCKQYPKGGMLVIANNKIIYQYEPEPVEIDPLDPPTFSNTDWPFEHEEYPFDKIDHVPTGRFYGDSIIVDLIPLQKEYNRTRSQMVEIKNRTAKPPLVYQKGSLDPTKVTSEPGLMLPVNAGFQFPQYMVQPQLPQYVMEEPGMITRDMDDISNQFEVAKGRTPPGIEAASAIAYLQEQNDDVLNHTIFSIEQAVEGAGRKTLKLVQQFWDDKKLIKVVSKNNALEVQLFKAADMKDNTDIRVEQGSMAPRSRAAKQAFITELMKLGVISNEQGLRYMQMNETNRLYEETQVDSRHAQRENLIMSKMKPPLDEMMRPMVGQPMSFPINEFDNDQMHEYEHALYMKSQEFTLLPPENQAMILQHYLLHRDKNALQQQSTQQLAGGDSANQGGEQLAV